VGRKNGLFVLTEARGKTASIMMSRVQSTEAAGVNVKLYLCDVLQRIGTESDLHKLLPHAWKERFEPEVLARGNGLNNLLVRDQRKE
jgi:hypothetical protein